ncbi:MAG: DUF86 domain-containing protein [Nitrospinae bacterium]|nr:DUF86 domain-containing protein [Nitrospinota bacterium]
MQLDPKDAARLFDILEAADKILRYTVGYNFKVFAGNDLLMDAVERNLEIIGEASRNISGSFKESHPDVPWREIVALRNILIHEYGRVRKEELWEIVTIHLPRLREIVAGAMPAPPADQNL